MGTATSATCPMGDRNIRMGDRNVRNILKGAVAFAPAALTRIARLHRAVARVGERGEGRARPRAGAAVHSPSLAERQAWEA